MEEAVLFKEQASAPPVGAGKAALYEAADKSLRYRRADGTEVNLTSALTLASILASTYPVGSIYIGVTSVSPTTLFGIGTWVAFGTGRMLVGIDAGQTEFDVVEETGGAKSITQTTAQMPVHTHVQNSHNHTHDPHNHTHDPHNHTQDAHGHSVNGNTASLNVGSSWAPGGGTTRGVLTATDPATATNQATTSTSQAATSTSQAATATNQNAGNGDPMTVLNPYIVVYMWKRTA